MASSANTVSLAILDDYAGIAPKFFQRIPHLQIDSFPDTLNPSDPADLDRLVTRLQPYQCISSMRERTPFPAALQKRLPNLKLLLNSSARNASIDLACATDRGIIVTGTKGDQPSDPAQCEELDDLPPPPGHSSVVQHAWAMVLGLCSRLPRDAVAMREDRTAWQSGMMTGLAGKTLGIVGLGKLGVGMAKVGVLGFGMQVLAWSENLTQEKADAAATGVGVGNGVFQAVGKEELFRRADVVSLHYVLSSRSRGFVGKRELGLMKKTAILVNTSRGPLVDEDELIAVLKEGTIKGVCLDVFNEEPLPSDSPWRTAHQWAKSDVVLSPHMGYVNAGTMSRWYQEQAENVRRWMRGEEVLHRMN
ncbi:hypothetical protein M433DRAFT_67379 [Acidomyces richmondensis BFW]|nr:MAG: hypothetical protein FE78DRAFT_148540 [Acidomyces sp. 'richmondensis']KYG45385.1 hypothetical protein M433DRAFT_67379 [Acidomyces richmondensis BFW]